LSVHEDLGKYLLNPKRTYTTRKGSMLLSMLPIGAPITAIVTEELGALGAREFLILGMAGGLAPALRPGDLVLCTKAVRDEGTSHHYLRGSIYVRPSDELMARIKNIIGTLGFKFAVGPTWTIDAPYMETGGEVAHYRKAGVLTVEMEAAALFAVAKKRRYKAAAVFAISDTLTDKGWSGFSRDVDNSFSKLASIAGEFGEWS
jgi:uridine phosphorylase